MKRNFVRLFQARFAPKVEDGTKTRTIRPKPDRMPEIGDTISLRTWTGKPYRSKQRILRTAVISLVEEVTIYGDSIQLGERRLSSQEREEFAIADGFTDFADMATWFRKEHDLPFEGIVIHWSNEEDAAEKFYPRFLCPKDGEIVTFKGCVWDERWEFGNPGAIYHPVCCYDENLSSLSASALDEVVENICIDLVVHGHVRRDWSPGELTDFHWRGVSPHRLQHRRSANHGEIRVRFFTNPKRPQDMQFELLPAET